MFDKRLRLTVDFRITAGEITREFVEDFYRDYVNFQEMMENELTWELMGRQNRLLQALIGNAEALNKFLTYVILGEVDPAGGSQLREMFGVQSEEEILGPVINSLERDDVEFFEGVIKDGLFHENTELFEYRVGVEWLGATLEGVRRVAEGVSESESDGTGLGDD
jgi:hypothetical protein